MGFFCPWAKCHSTPALGGLKAGRVAVLPRPHCLEVGLFSRENSTTLRPQIHIHGPTQWWVWSISLTPLFHRWGFQWSTFGVVAGQSQPLARAVSPGGTPQWVVLEREGSPAAPGPNQDARRGPRRRGAGPEDLLDHLPFVKTSASDTKA